MSRPVNIYELLDDDSSSGQKGPVQKPKSNTAVPVVQQKATTTQQVNRAPARSQDRKPREEGRGGFTEQVSDRKPRTERAPREAKAGGFTEVRAPRNPNQRQYDRKSGTGRGRETKRAGGGRGNWGSVNDEVKPVVEEGEEKTTQEVQPTEAPAETTAEVPSEEKTAEDEAEAKQKTLDEYLSTIKKVNLSLPAPRQPGEGQEVSPQWASYTALKKDDEDEEVTKTEKKKAETKESSKQTISADQVIHFKESPKGGSFRGGRGGRGGRRGGEGSPRGGRGEGSARGRGEGSPRGGRGGQKRGGAPGTRAPGLTEENFPALKA